MNVHRLLTYQGDDYLRAFPARAAGWASGN